MIFNKASSLYSLRKCKIILRQATHLYLRKRKNLSSSEKEKIQEVLSKLQEAILKRERERADELAKQSEKLVNLHLKKSRFEQIRDLILALLFALVVATIIRQMWFEFYEIPSGSMRPTLKEQDRLMVSKTDFGINLPLTPQHLYFDPHLVQRGGIVIFTGENMDIRDVDTLYFYIFPGKKQYVKRLIGKPGDILYFYGGLIYGIDQEGKDISSELQLARLDKIDHIPFIHFEGKTITPRAPVQGVDSPVILYQMNEPVAKLYLTPNHHLRGDMLKPVAHYSDLWGFKNYGMGRLLSREEVIRFTDQNLSGLQEGVLYLELKHHPSLSSLQLVRDERDRLRPVLSLETSLLPLQEAHLRALFDNLYTARFVVKNGVAWRYGMEKKQAAQHRFLPKLEGVPDGCYEFYNGRAYQVQWEGITKELPPSHPLTQFSPARVQLFYNLGIEFDTRFAPYQKNQRLMPSRYAYYRQGNLYLLGAPIFKKADPLLIDFLNREMLKQSKTPSYHPFEDTGPPLLVNGQLDTAFVKQYGITIPPKMYLVLGDNHAMSADSRDFGFVPQQNLRGGPDFIFWPPGSRWGTLNQLPYPFFNIPRTIIWILAAICLCVWRFVHNKRNRLPLKFD